MNEKLLEAMMITKDEVLEELDALIEGADPIQSRSSIEKMLNALIETLEHPDIVDEDSFPSKFSIGEEVWILRTYALGDERLYSTFKSDISEFSQFTRGRKKGIILQKAVDPIDLSVGSSNPDTAYVVESDGIKYFVCDPFLEKIE